MIIEKTSKVKGRYTLEVIKPNGDIETHQQDNLLTDEFVKATDGLASKFTFNLGSYVRIRVGTGTAAPDVTDTALENAVAQELSVSSIGTSSVILPESDSNIYVLRNETVTTFDLGAINDTITEIGATRYSGNSTVLKLISRSLLDTPVTIAPEDQLRVIWTLDMYLDATPVVETVDINGSPTEVTLRLHNIQDRRLWRPYYVNCMDVFSVCRLSGTTGNSGTTKSQPSTLEISNIGCDEIYFGIATQSIPASGLVAGGAMSEYGFQGLITFSNNTSGNDILTTISEELPDGNNIRDRVYKSALDTDKGNEENINIMFYAAYPDSDSNNQRNYWKYVPLTATFNPPISKTDLQRFEFDFAMRYERA